MYNQSVCYIFGAGERHGRTPVIKPSDFVIAADGGLIYAREWEITPNLVVGDFDSLDAPPSDANTVVLPQEKDDTDMVAALREGWNRGFRVFHIYGGTGGRLDHTLANIQCLADLALRGGRGYLHGADCIITAIRNDSIAFPADAEGVVSVFCYSDAAAGVCEEGLKYPLCDVALRNTYPLGVSNEFIGRASRISVKCGTLVIIYPQNTREEHP